MKAELLIEEIERRLEIRLSGTDAARLANPSSAEALLELIRRWREGEKPTEALDLLALLDPAAIARVATRVLGDYEADLRSEDRKFVPHPEQASAFKAMDERVKRTGQVSQRPARRRK